jgi:hypothetical protein
MVLKVLLDLLDLPAPLEQHQLLPVQQGLMGPPDLPVPRVKQVDMDLLALRVLKVFKVFKALKAILVLPVLQVLAAFKVMWAQQVQPVLLQQ